MKSNFLKADLKASLVVFLVALPLCLGIALASGVSPSAGLITGIVGGIIVGFLAGCPLQVSGPAAGLVVIVWEVVNNVGIAGLCAAVILGGALQILGAWLKVGRWFQAVSPAVVQGMLSSIGILIVLSQVHTLFDIKPQGSGGQNIASLYQLLVSPDFRAVNSPNLQAGIVGISSIFLLLAWPKFAPKKLLMIPPALLAVGVWTFITSFWFWNLKRVEVPLSFFDSFRFDGLSTLASAPNAQIIIAGITIALVASAESLLSCGAVQRLAPWQKVDYNKELFAQGCGNFISGIFGGLPLTGVIVRSATNISAGAQTRFATIFHGVWLLAFVCFAPRILNLIPTSVLAGVLVYFGGKLVKPQAFREFSRNSRSEGLLFLATIAAIVFTDLLTGVMLGVALSLLRLVFGVSKLDIHVSKKDGTTQVHLSGVASFLSIPRLDTQLERVPSQGTIVLDTQQLHSIDQACIDLVQNWQKTLEKEGVRFELVGPPVESLKLRLIKSSNSLTYAGSQKSA